MKRFIPFLVAAFVPLMITRADAIEISIEKGNCCAVIVVSGPIEVGDGDRFKTYLEQNGNWRHLTVSFDSPGGSLIDGIQIGRLVREVRADTSVERYPPRTPEMTDLSIPEPLKGAECYSACALAFMGGFNRTVPEGSSIGFHQFSGGNASTADEAMQITQLLSSVIASYLRDMGAKPELFELMSLTLPGGMFNPTRDEIVALGIETSTDFRDFRLMPKGDLIVATATNERNPDALQRVYEIETFCWKATPVMNLYAVSPERGLSPEQASATAGYMDGVRIDTELGEFVYGGERIRLYPGSRLLEHCPPSMAHILRRRSSLRSFAA